MRNRMSRRSVLITALVSGAFLMVGCDDSDEGAGGAADNAGEACASTAECYDGIDPAALSGPVNCLDNVPGGYCTHECASDADCCAVEGECVSGFEQVCSPLESAAAMYCFVTCEGAADNYCEDYVNPGLHCRSSGGGSANRKLCLPD